MNPLDLNCNKSTIFLLPLTQDKDIKYNDIITKDFENTYIADVDEPAHDDKVLLTRTGKEKYEVLDFKPEMGFNLAIFLQGYYSNFNEPAKEMILNFWEQDDTSELYKVLHKQLDKGSDYPPGRDGELVEPPDIREELMNLVLPRLAESLVKE